MYSAFLRFPGGKLKALTFSYDDGPKSDLRLAALFDRHALRGTFNLNADNIGREGRLTAEEIRRSLLDAGHEIAVHGDRHRAPGKTRPVEGIAEVLDCRRKLEDAFGLIVRGMAYPNSGIRHFSPGISYGQVKSYLTQLDIAYARTLAGDNDGFYLPEDWHAWMPTAHHNNPELFAWAEKFLALSDRTCRGDEGMPRLFYIWGHSFEFDRDGNWDRMEDLCALLAGRDDVWYATNGEICDYVSAYGALVYSADGRRAYNPTLRDVFLCVDDVPRVVRSGETTLLY